MQNGRFVKINNKCERACFLLRRKANRISPLHRFYPDGIGVNNAYQIRMMPGAPKVFGFSFGFPPKKKVN